MHLVESTPASLVVLDLSEVRFIDAHSVGLIVAASAAAHRRRRTLIVEGLRGIPATVVRRLGLEPLLTGRLTERIDEFRTERDTGVRGERIERLAVWRRFDGGPHATG